MHEKNGSTSMDSSQGAESHYRSFGDAGAWSCVSRTAIRECQRKLNEKHATVDGGRHRRRASACARHEDEGFHVNFIIPNGQRNFVCAHPLPARLCTKFSDKNDKSVRRAFRARSRLFPRTNATECEDTLRGIACKR